MSSLKHSNSIPSKNADGISVKHLCTEKRVRNLQGYALTSTFNNWCEHFRQLPKNESSSRKLMDDSVQVSIF